MQPKSTPAGPRITRLQFSLRMLLLLMVAVSVGLTIYRWPWEVKGGPSKSKPPEFASRTITLRRNWHGKPEQHGLERWFDGQRNLIAERLYVDDQLMFKPISAHTKLGRSGSLPGVLVARSTRGACESLVKVEGQVCRMPRAL